MLLNASYGLVAAGFALSVPAGIEKARQAIDDGLALRKLEELVALTNA